MSTVSMFVGSIRPLPESGRPSGIYKQPLRGETRVLARGFADDRQADLRVHGGPEKAVHLYPAGHYRELAQAFAQAAPLLLPGSIGENLSSAELDETVVHLGSSWRLGEAVLQVCQPRNPCWKIDERFGCQGMAAFIVERRLTGWYLRVLQEGRVSPGDGLEVVDGAPQAPTLRQALDDWHAAQPRLDALRRIAETPGVALHWRARIEQRIAWLQAQQGRTGGPGG